MNKDQSGDHVSLVSQFNVNPIYSHTFDEQYIDQGDLTAVLARLEIILSSQSISEK